ncbi:hypothetical protein GGTG_10159 [Gaeumannomyces tritici R3-111a-1]|uniref:Uncharacterized protein n=1 Tax=Gaeumannomyces tritici (strain R3-111a-1) TaxID=644352 RepID=J3P9H9_GAET3|nr:hypothetical protein GGTG_10159 [Gaeumannomyces tritici R3-111a-1]EJT73315.1 hypothetical protein GGTG_10159 [Gaeumannomyces tritici R3-111a-1]
MLLLSGQGKFYGRQAIAAAAVDRGWKATANTPSLGLSLGRPADAPANTTVEGPPRGGLFQPWRIFLIFADAALPLQTNHGRWRRVMICALIPGGSTTPIFICVVNANANAHANSARPLWRGPSVPRRGS